ncbi:MAG TPA: (2Fe-2S)-binding protein [Syntrophorhabdales bacterium]|nr:(2Fe-2S)-binding protein [Syntrophorhabdales bacterium]
MKKKDTPDEDITKRGLTRRQFLTTMGVGTAAVAVSGSRPGHAAEEEAVIKAGEMTRITLNINGRRHRLMVEPRWSLLFLLRERLGLTGTKVGCERGECGACTVLINDVPRYACLTLAVEAEGARITTVEGLMKGEELGPVQQAFLEEDAFQCGYCTPGQIMTIEGLLRTKPDPAVDEIRTAMGGNLCRCGTYTHILNAAKRAAALKRKAGGA